MEQRRLHRARAKPLNVLQGFADFRICLIEDVQWWTPKSTFEGGPAGMVTHAGRRHEGPRCGGMWMRLLSSAGASYSVGGWAQDVLETAGVAWLVRMLGQLSG